MVGLNVPTRGRVIGRPQLIPNLLLPGVELDDPALNPPASNEVGGILNPHARLFDHHGYPASGAHHRNTGNVPVTGRQVTGGYVLGVCKAQATLIYG